MTEFAEEIREFLVESHENLNALSQEMVELEKAPADERRMASIFRIIHTLKGTSEFFGFHVIGSIAHILESLLAQVREKTRPMTPVLVSLILEALDAVKQVLGGIEANHQEGVDRFQLLRERLSAAYQEPTPASNVAEPDPRGLAHESQMPSRRADDRRGGEGARPGERTSRSEDGGGGAGDRFEGSRASDRAASSTIRVDVELLDRMLSLVEGLATAHDQMLEVPSQRIEVMTSELRECVMLARMQPIGMLWNKLPRAVRDVAAEMGKLIELQMDGALTELDRTIIEAVSDPLTHMVRNACDHGIELPRVRVASGKNAQGTIRLRAFEDGGEVHIEVSDDGAGIDPEKIKNKALQKGLIQPEQAASMGDAEALRLIFLPGLTTTDIVTSVSGRGVGMDVVKTNIEKIHGTVDLASCIGVGTTLTIRIPPRPSSSRGYVRS